ncbi:CocE/NonD family hydrolase [Patulibacter defluvii]|uniref:CocE/NonD family hydrolase n=1 Tax=Patulibacter defluvii TaxID=3095358 RepID=UPI002A75C374|nr:CocE/NonD family hydrolase [Patulibacter sp. DM4]
MPGRGTERTGSPRTAARRRRALARLAALAAATAALLPAAAAADGPRRLTGYLPTADGTQLHYSVLLPADDGPHPAVMTYSGYDSGSLGGSADQAGNGTFSASQDQELVARGYAVVGVNMRGTACSEGSFDLFSGQWGRDGADAVEWVARQPWSNGRVGMANWSWAGLSQLFTAQERPPHLRAIAPGMVVADPLRDVGGPGGVPNVQFPADWWLFIQTRWLAASQTALLEGDVRCLLNVVRNIAAGQDVSPPALLGRHQFDDDPFFLGRRIDARRIRIPVLSMEAWQDEATGPRGGHYQRDLDPARTWFVGTNGRHDVYFSRRFRATLFAFLDRFVKGEANGFERRPRVQLWRDATAGGGEGGFEDQMEAFAPTSVIERPSLPLAVTPLRLALRGGGRLTEAPATAGESPDGYRGGIAGPAVNDLRESGEWAGRPPDRDGARSYTTGRLPQELTVAGPASVDLWVSSAATDTDLQVTLTEVRPDGQEAYLQRGWLRASARAIDPARSSPLLPFHRQVGGDQRPLVPGVPVLARVELQKLVHTFRAGSSIRIWIDGPSTTGEFGFAPATATPENRLWHDPARPSRLVLGVLDGPVPGGPRPACDRVLFEPCRTNPVAVPAGVGPRPPQTAAAPAAACLPARIRVRGDRIGRVRIGAPAAGLARLAVAPTALGRHRRWCVEGGGAVVALLDRRGRVWLVASSAPGHRAGGVGPRTADRRLRDARTVAPGVRRVGRLAFAVAGGRVRTVAVAAPALARNGSALRRALATARRALARPAAP